MILTRLIALLQSGSENRETFFARIVLFFPILDPRYLAIERAYNAAKDAFREIKREGGQRYFEHLRAVALILIVHLRVKNHNIIIAALLHDLVEDCPEWTIQRVRAEFGDEVALLVDFLTKHKFPGKTDEECAAIYHERFRFAPREFFLIKLADRLHNLITLWACSPEKRRRKIAETRAHYLFWAEEHCILIHEIEGAIELLENDMRVPSISNETQQPLPLAPQ